MTKEKQKEHKKPDYYLINIYLSYSVSQLYKLDECVKLAWYEGQRLYAEIK